MRLRTVAFFAPHVLRSPPPLFFFFFFVEKVVFISGAFLFLSLACSVTGWIAKTVEFVLKFNDRTGEQKIWFSHGVQIWFVCDSATESSQNFQSHIQTHFFKYPSGNFQGALLHNR